MVEHRKKTEPMPSPSPPRTETVTNIQDVLEGDQRRPGLVRVFPRKLNQAPEIWPLPRAGLVIGRCTKAAVYLDDGSVSREHLRLEPTAYGAKLTDLGSRHGTFINGEPLASTSQAASFGSVIRVGKSLLLLVENVDAYAAAPERVSGSALGTRASVIAGPALAQAWQQARQVASLAQPVLVRGESGSGKEAIARLVHAHRERPGPFVAINIAAISEGLFESELFGHVKGAFTGATNNHAGAFCEANGGVLFLDEVGDLRRDLQPKLLRAIDQLRVRPVGGKEDVPTNVRVVAATSQDLHEACAAGKFRLDLYYRLAGIVIHVPPLCERRDDIIMLALTSLAEDYPALELSAAAAEILCLARWEGNVRQLHHALTHAAVQALAAGTNKIFPAHLPPLTPSYQEAPNDGAAIREALLRTDGNAARAAKLLQISRTTLYNKLKREGIDPAQLR